MGTDETVEMSDPRVALEMNEEDSATILEELRITLAKHDCGLLKTARETVAEALAWFTVEGA